MPRPSGRRYDYTHAHSLWVTTRVCAAAAAAMSVYLVAPERERRGRYRPVTVCVEDVEVGRCAVYSVCRPIYSFSSQVKKIASILKIVPLSLYLVEEAENVAIFPDELGQFRPSQLTVGLTYEVHGDSTDKPIIEQSSTSQPSTPYGAYTSPAYPQSKQPLMHTSKSKALRRSIH